MQDQTVNNSASRTIDLLYKGDVKCMKQNVTCHVKQISVSLDNIFSQ